MLGRYTGNLAKTCLRVLFSCPLVMYMFVVTTVYVCMLLSPALARRKLFLGRPGKKTPYNQCRGTRDGSIGEF